MRWQACRRLLAGPAKTPGPAPLPAPPPPACAGILFTRIDLDAASGVAAAAMADLDALLRNPPVRRAPEGRHGVARASDAALLQLAVAAVFAGDHAAGAAAARAPGCAQALGMHCQQSDERGRPQRRRAQRRRAAGAGGCCVCVSLTTKWRVAGGVVQGRGGCEQRACGGWGATRDAWMAARPRHLVITLRLISRRAQLFRSAAARGAAPACARARAGPGRAPGVRGGRAGRLAGRARGRAGALAAAAAAARAAAVARRPAGACWVRPRLSPSARRGVTGSVRAAVGRCCCRGCQCCCGGLHGRQTMPWTAQSHRRSGLCDCSCQYGLTGIGFLHAAGPCEVLVSERQPRHQPDGEGRLREPNRQVRWHVRWAPWL